MAKPPSLTQRSMLSDVQRVPINDIQPHPKNPRKGNVTIIAESLEANGQFLPLVVQESTKHILSGNHTWKAARSLGWDTIDVTFVEVGDESALRILLVANRASDFGQYDSEALAEIMDILDDPIGTGYTDDEMGVIISSIDDANAEVNRTIEEMLLPESTPEPVGPVIDVAPANVPEGDESEDEEPWEEDLEKQDPRLNSVYQLDDRVEFDNGWGQWEIPSLLPHMLLDKLPKPLKTWAGTATKDESDHEVWWLYNFGVDSQSGMFDKSRVVLSFYAYDEVYLDKWYMAAAAHTSRAINLGIKMALTPNFSVEGMPRGKSMFQTYKSRWVGRFLQESGIAIIPDLEWASGDEELVDTVVKSVPQGAPVVAFQAQNLSTKDDPEAMRVRTDELMYAVEEIEPQQLLLYAGPAGRNWVQGLNLPCQVVWLNTRRNIFEKSRQRGSNAAIDKGLRRTGG